ncbi:excinuclease ABC subunit UvrA [Candidatus Peregrinibacteria bacterium]|nr:excinuclease ABC subunit UvrA [Candidatus Peregrinibacteria bacterium]
MVDVIRVEGARMHNLKNITVQIPRSKLVVITGVSGSGKSSLAFDTIYAEGQRRYVESLSTYARQFLGLMEKPDVDVIEGLSPAISIDQKTASRNPRSTVGTVTEIYDYLRLLFAKIGRPHCPVCALPVQRQSVSQVIDEIGKMKEGTKVMILAPVIRGRKGEHSKVLEKIQKDGFIRIRVDGVVYSIADKISIDPKKSHSIEAVVDRLVVKNFEKTYQTLSSGEKVEEPNPDRTRLADSIELGVKYGNGILEVMNVDTGEMEMYSEKFACPEHGSTLSEIEPRNFSFNSPYGACPDCHGLGSRLVVKKDLVFGNPKLTIAEGAIMPWATTTSGMSWYLKILEKVGMNYGFSLDIPVEKLTPEQVDIILSGTGDEEYDIKMDSRKFSGEFSTKYEGVAKNLERRFQETESELSRKQIEKFMEEELCPTCKGQRLRPEVLSVLVGEKNIIAATQFSISEAHEFFQELPSLLTEREQKIAHLILQEIISRLHFLEHVGLSYLTLSRSANTLSGGEAQRIRLATQIGSKLQGVLYVLDEPSIGLHQRDNKRLIETMRDLQRLGNTVLVVEHDEDTMNAADHILEIGPGAGKYGGQVVAEGTPEEIKRNPNSGTGKYLSGEKSIPIPSERRKGNGKSLKIIGARENNLHNIDVEIPLGKFVGVTGVSGSGKSSLVNKILGPSLANQLNRAQKKMGNHDDILGVNHLDKVIIIDQSPIGRTPRSNPATYTGVFGDIRELFSSSPEAKLRGYKAGRFSFNVKGGRCEACQGDGIVKIEMHFLPDIYVPCEVCHGKRYNSEALEITWRGKNIADVLDMTVSEALEYFVKIPSLKNKLQTLEDVGLGYIHLGQSAPTLSGGEAQRVKLATELSKRSTGKTFFILDEPTTGLHFEDVQKLLDVLNALVNKGNTVLVIEHNLDVVKSCDYVIDLGPDGGENGGYVVATGSPEEVAKSEKSYTGQFLRKYFQ